MTQAYSRYENDGIGIDDYIASMDENRDAFLRNIEQTRISPKHLEFFKSEPLHFLVITENWCIDSVQLVPALVKLARQAKNIDIRVLLRDQHRDLADRYRNSQGYQPIPVIIAFDQQGNELGHLLERPEAASRELAEETRRFQDANPELDGIKRNFDRMPEQTRNAVKAHSRQWRLGRQQEFADHLLEELSDIIKTGLRARAA